jgi:hypothetical protein
MPYPESCPECGGAFRNTGTHYTARRNEVGRHILLELGCQNASRRYWWDFTSGTAAEDGTTPGRRATVSNGSVYLEANGRGNVATLEPPASRTTNGRTTSEADLQPKPDIASTPLQMDQLPTLDFKVAQPESNALEAPAVPPAAAGGLKDAFVRQLQLDRLTLRQMRSWLMADEARRAIEVAAGATEATYERLALILFGVDLPQLLGKQAAPPPNPGMSAEERLELQREKARIRARLRRAAAKAARTSEP